MAASMPDRRHAGFRIALVVLGGIVVLAAAEGSLRMSGLAPPPALSTVSDADFQRVPGIFDPGQVVRQQPGTDFEHRVTIDSLGYRGADFPRARPPGEVRVLFAGDSFTFGHNVEDHETLPARLERVLADRCGSARVVNAGLSGSTILAQAELIRRGLVLDPTQVVLMYHENDLDELAHVRIWEQLARNRRVKSSFPLSLPYRAARHSALGAVALQARVSYQFRRQRLARNGSEPDESWVEPTRREYRERLQGIGELLAAAGTPLLFVAFPHPESVAAGQGGRDYDWVLETAAGLAIPTVDLLSALRSAEAGVDSLFLVPRDYHPSPYGHAYAARLVAGFLACREE
jgi:hypothetical protein